MNTVIQTVVIITKMVTYRVFVGNLFQNYETCLDELKSRFNKFGKCSDVGFEKFNTFAYINIDFEDESFFNKLKQSLNNVKFKGNLLKIDIAKPDWKARWDLQHENDLKEDIKIGKFNKEQEWKHYKKLENINMSWKDQKEIIPGRYRKTERSRTQLRNPTFRVNVNGSLKVYKLYKNKLWGYERNKTVKDLAYQYINGKWWNNYNHIIDRLDYSRSRRTINHKNIIEYNIKQESKINPTSFVSNKNGSDDKINKKNEDDEIDLEEQMIQEERSKNSSILDQILGEVNFDKPLTVVDSDEAETFGFSDKEEDEDKEVIPEESEEEYIPTFGVTKGINEQVSEPVQGTISNTEALRALFNPETANDPMLLNSGNNNNEHMSKPFKLIQDDDEDIDQSKTLPEDVINEQYEENINAVQNNSISKTHNQNRLFFPHFDSPFLVGQTQLAQIETRNKNDIWSNWEEQFWENRGLWMKEMKNKRRDALRQRKKRQAKDSNSNMIMI